MKIKSLFLFTSLPIICVAPVAHTVFNFNQEIKWISSEDFIDEDFNFIGNTNFNMYSCWDINPRKIENFDISWGLGFYWNDWRLMSTSNYISIPHYTAIASNGINTNNLDFSNCWKLKMPIEEIKKWFNDDIFSAQKKGRKYTDLLQKGWLIENQKLYSTIKDLACTNWQWFTGNNTSASCRRAATFSEKGEDWLLNSSKQYLGEDIHYDLYTNQSWSSFETEEGEEKIKWAGVGKFYEDFFINKNNEGRVPGGKTKLVESSAWINGVLPAIADEETYYKYVSNISYGECGPEWGDWILWWHNKKYPYIAGNFFFQFHPERIIFYLNKRQDGKIGIVWDGQPWSCTVTGMKNEADTEIHKDEQYPKDTTKWWKDGTMEDCEPQFVYYWNGINDGDADCDDFWEIDDDWNALGRIKWSWQKNSFCSKQYIFDLSNPLDE